MAWQLRLWPYFAILGFLGLGISLKVWSSKKLLFFWLRSCSVWFALAFLSGLAFVQLLRSLPASHSTWQARWAVPDWQLNLWFLSTLPAFLFIPHDLLADKGGFERSELGLLLGAAFGPWLIAAFPMNQIFDFSIPFLLLGAVFYLLPGSRRGYRGPLLCLIAFNFFAFVHGILIFPPWLSGITLVLVLAIGLCPYRIDAALFASALGILSLYVRPHSDTEEAWVSILWTSIAIGVGWWMRGSRRELHA